MRASVFVACLVLAACGSTASPPPPPSSPSPASSARLVAPSSCLMTHVCGCNLGCARVALEAASLREGMLVTAQTGPYAGKELRVMKEADDTGASVFTLSDRERASPCERETPESKSLMAFVCAAKDSGPVPARACAKGCD